MYFSQCVDYALDQWWGKGGGIIFTRSTHWCVPHLQHISRDLEITHFVPPGDLPAPWYSVLGFWGDVEVGDKDWLKRQPPNKFCLLVGTVLLLILGGVWAVKRTMAAVFRPIP